MQCQYVDRHALDLAHPSSSDGVPEQVLDLVNNQPIHFQTHFEGYMEMYSDSQTVAEYLQKHEGWFPRCAQPMTAEPIGNNGYILVIGQYGAFGYEVEPKIAVVLEPPKDGLYYMHSTPIPGHDTPGYHADYQAYMELEEIPVEIAGPEMARVYKKSGITELPSAITKIRWQLHLEVAVQFPQFIYKLPIGVIQKTGDRVLTEIVRQVSPRLTDKVQYDFHSSFDLPLPPKGSRNLQPL